MLVLIAINIGINAIKNRPTGICTPLIGDLYPLTLPFVSFVSLIKIAVRRVNIAVLPVCQCQPALSPRHTHLSGHGE